MNNNDPVRNRWHVGCALLVFAGFGSFAGFAPSVADESEGLNKPAAPLSAFKASAKVDDDELKSIAGKADVAQSVVATNTSNVSNNSVNGQSSTGTLTFASDAFQSLHGLAVISANTGNNVSINTSMNVNVALQR